ncbi:MAG: NupC/NupG family nucleoside CNT transporter [Bacteriovoracales bacterium]|nr:NupC/NupG family nucleoside CNT transporter [Bacteriovoracales bacterium]
MEKMISLIGLVFMVAVAYGLSSSRKNINWRLVIVGVLLQSVFGLIILKTDFGAAVFEGAKNFFMAILDFTNEGSRFIFGPLTDNQKMGFIFATMVLPTIVFFSSLMSVLYHLGIMQILVGFFARCMVKLMGTSGAESLATAANIFVGQTEAPLCIKPYVNKMTYSELMALMSGGMATVAGGVMAAYVGLGIDAGHLLAASVMSAPAALVCAKIMIPETERPQTIDTTKAPFEKTTINVIDAATTGAIEGLKLALNVGAMLLAFIALIAMLNSILSYAGSLFSYPGLSIELIMGYVLSPISFLIGIPWNEAQEIGSLLGKKLVINEFVAYMDLQTKLDSLSPRSITIATYALCGFSNFSSIAIQIGGIGTIAPDRRNDLARLGVKSLIAGTLACLMTASIAGLLV